MSACLGQTRIQTRMLRCKRFSFLGELLLGFRKRLRATCRILFCPLLGAIVFRSDSCGTLLHFRLLRSEGGRSFCIHAFRFRASGCRPLLQ